MNTKLFENLSCPKKKEKKKDFSFASFLFKKKKKSQSYVGVGDGRRLFTATMLIARNRPDYNRSARHLFVHHK